MRKPAVIACLPASYICVLDPTLMWLQATHLNTSLVPRRSETGITLLKILSCTTKRQITHTRDARTAQTTAGIRLPQQVANAQLLTISSLSRSCRRKAEYSSLGQDLKCRQMQEAAATCLPHSCMGP